MAPVRREPEGSEVALLAETREDRKSSSTLLTVCPFILGNEFCERLAFYGLSTNLVIYLMRRMGTDPATASIQQMLFEGTCYITPLLGAWLADSHWGRYKTILVFSLIYLLGMVMLASSACIPGFTPGPHQEQASWFQSSLLYASLYVVALGTGGIKPNVSAFGADQFDESDPQDVLEKKSFFNWFYFAINIGSLLAVTVVVYIQDSISWAIGFAIPAAAMLLAILTFIGGSSRYRHVEPTESPMARVVKVLWAATKKRWSRKARRPALSSFDGPVNLPPDMEPGFSAPGMRKAASYQWLQDAVADAQADPQEGGLAGFSAEQVEEVRCVVRMLPIFFTTILYWTIYAQMGSFFVEQGAAMDRDTFGGKFTIPAASLAIFNTLGIIILIPIYDQGLVPLLKCFGTKLTHLQRIGWGLFVCILAMLSAAAVEYVRLLLFRHGDVLPDRGHMHSLLGGGTGTRIVNLSVFWQIPQYLLVGLSEVLASIGQLEFFYDQAPDIMRSCSMALQLLSVAVGSYLSGAMVWAVQAITAKISHGEGWLPRDMNYGHLDYFFLFLAGAMALNLGFFMVVASRYRYKAVAHPHRVPASRSPPPPSLAAAMASSERAIAIGYQAPPGAQLDAGLYGRSISYVPDSPALPAPFR